MAFISELVVLLPGLPDPSLVTKILQPGTELEREIALSLLCAQFRRALLENEHLRNELQGYLDRRAHLSLVKP